MKVSARSNYIITGLALFSMFFGAGNIVFPLHLGALAAQPIGLSILGFILTGVGIPFLGLIAISLYKGDYWNFFKPIGVIPAFLIITFIILIIGPLFATPRIVTVAHQTVKPFLPQWIEGTMIFQAVFCLVAFGLSISIKWMIRVLGLYLTPIMLVLFLILIGMGFYLPADPLSSAWSAGESVQQAIVFGYGTMDLLGAVFFAQVAYLAISKQLQSANHQCIVNETVKASLLGGLILALVYVCFILVGFYHASVLQNVPQDQTIQVMAHALLGNMGSLLICVSVTLACLSTAVALIEVSTIYIYSHIFVGRVPRFVCALCVTVSIYAMSHLEFSGIMALAYPILTGLYPLLIAYCLWHIVKKLRMKTSMATFLSFRRGDPTMLKGE